ncbi:helix-turn-helix domain-containing protein [Aneurinibacillus migulanus]|jgi:transposase-like protein|uniref:Transposase n=1 Tax=Aneurinibacillus migulanus TaxID=47500 RepID=A0A1G8HXS3_ANEMI|nr:hypothetical protein AMI01nite_02940 [Aneurinibacillus migulanus]SDI11433.1 Transposase [Aneurinibacillus migulanus]
MKRSYSLTLKRNVVSEVMKGHKCSIVARKYGINSQTIYRWIREYKEMKENYRKREVL